ncbi:aldo/keto reductase [Candidatus Latescibacterota bacterium]
MDRRIFLKTGVVAGTFMTLSGASNSFSQMASSAGAKIRYRTLGSTGWKVCEIGFGAMNMRDPELVRAAVEAGINYFDTADGYMNGRNEEVLGSVLSEYRDKVFITTKVDNGNDLPRLERDVNASLKRLRTDYVDAVLLHSGSARQMRSQQVIDAFGNIRQSGKARFVGVSSHSGMATVLDSVTESRFWQIATVSYNFSSPQEVTDAIARARSAGIAIVAMKTQNNGRGGAKLASATMTPNQGALRWVLQNKNVDTTIPGITSFDHIAEDMKVMEMELSLKDRRGLLRYGESLKGKYCSGINGCTGCLNQCPYGVQVHEINRCLGYAHGYKDIQLARVNYNRLPSHLRADACSRCDTCKVKCVNGLNLDENIQKARILFG